MVLDHCDNVDARGGTFNLVGGNLHNNITIGHQTVVNILSESSQTFKELPTIPTQLVSPSFNLDLRIVDVPVHPSQRKTKVIQGDTTESTSSAFVCTKPTDAKILKWGYGRGAERWRGGNNLPTQESLEPSPLSSPRLLQSDTSLVNRDKQIESHGRSGCNHGSGGLWRPMKFLSWLKDSRNTELADAQCIGERVNTTDRLDEMRMLMARENLDYYVIPSDYTYQSEYVTASDKRNTWISGLTGSAGQAVISKTTAYLVTNPQYWLQAQAELDNNWHVILAGSIDGPKDWIEWLISWVKDSRVGIDARMLSHEKAILLITQLTTKSSKLIFPPQNFIDLIWKDKPARLKEVIFIQPVEFMGKEASQKLAELRFWIKKQQSTSLPYSKTPPALITSPSSIAYLLNLRGGGIQFNWLFQAYFFVSLDNAILFTDSVQGKEDVRDYLHSLGIKIKKYDDLWTFLRKREWGEGKLVISAQIPYAISLILTPLRYTITPIMIDNIKAIKNQVELDGIKQAYLRDGATFVRWFAWLEDKLLQGNDITEYDAASRLTEFRQRNKHYLGLPYENTSASGPNAALPHYSPTKNVARIIDRKTPYIIASGGQYRDGTCATSRTVHFGRPTQEQSDAYTRLLQGHIAIDRATFPEGTTDTELNILAHSALWKDGLNYMQATGHGFGSFLNVHEGSHSFSPPITLVPGHVILNEPCFYLRGQWGMRIKSALALKRVNIKEKFKGDICLGFERLTCVPIQTKMVKMAMLSREEKQWLKEHNQHCRDLLELYLKDDKCALKWLRREASRGIGIAAAGPGGITIDWD